MSHWITTQTGKRIDLDWLDPSKDFNTAIRDYFITTKLREVHISNKEVYYALNKAYNERHGRYKKSMCDVFFIPTRVKVDGHYEYEYNYYVTGRNGNGSIKVFDIISEKEISYHYDYIDSLWG